MEKILFVAAITAALATLVVVLDHHPVGGVLLVELATAVKPLGNQLVSFRRDDQEQAHPRPGGQPAAR